MINAQMGAEAEQHSVTEATDKVIMEVENVTSRKGIDFFIMEPKCDG